MARVPLFIDPKSLNTQVSTVTLARGGELYRSLAVLDYEVDVVGDGKLELEGEVQGSLPDPYWVNVTLHTAANGLITYFDGNCSCPVGSDCKHAIALTLKAASESERTGDSPAPAAPSAKALTPAEQEAVRVQTARLSSQQAVDQWLGGFAEAPADTPLSTSAAPPPDQMVYMLVPATKGADTVLNIGFGLSRQMVRKSGWAKVRPLDYVSPASASPEDREAVQLLQALGAQTYGYSASTMPRQLTGEVGQLALRLAAGTGRLFSASDWQTLEQPLTLGPPRSVQWRWEENKGTPDGTATDPDDPAWTLQPQLDGAGTTLYRNTPPLYVDLDAGVCGLVESPGIAPHDLPLLLKAPPIPRSSFARHQTTLLRRLSHLPLPPTIARPQVLEGVAPVAHLHLAPMAPADVPQWGLVAARLQFDYAGFRLQPSDAQHSTTPLLLEADGKSMLVHRDLEAEHQARERLFALGLVADPRGRLCVPPGPPAQPSVWLQWADTDFAPLRGTGWVVTLDHLLHNWITRVDTLTVAMAPEGNLPGSSQADGDDSRTPWFALSLGVEINGERHNILPWLPALLDQLGPAMGSVDGTEDGGDNSARTAQMPHYVYLPQAIGRGYLRLPTAPLRPWLQALLDLVGERGQGFDGDSLRLSRLEALRMGAALGEGAQWEGAASLHRLVQQLAGQTNLPDVPVPTGLVASLRPYQQQGLNWLQFLREHGLAGVLADDMGLGKTLQTLAHILLEKEQGRLTDAALIVAPVSLMGNWLREAARFTPGLRTLVLHGQDRHGAAADIADYDVVIAPYSLLQRDRDLWLARRWHLVVLDEAQNIKNASTGAAQVAAELDATHRLCLSGTPMENHLGELWSLFHFLMPGFLGSQKRFKELFRTPIEKHGDSERLTQLRARVTPFMLRRTKREVATELPDKVESIAGVTLEGKQADLYETIRLTTEKAVRDALADKGLAQSQIQILDALLKLRQVCCDPRLVPLASAQKIQQSAKLDLLMELLPEMLAEGRKVLLFSQFTSMLELIEEALKARDLPWVKLTGQSRNRDAIIDRFTSGEVPLFLISLKAGGVGLNLPQADTVIHYDPWWNPAVENQATDRAHRIGQKNRVFVYKLVAHGTIEERILALQERKAALADSMYSGAQARKQPLFTESDIAELLRPLGS